jgi:hypothetical protein
MNAMLLERSAQRDADLGLIVAQLCEEISQPRRISRQAKLFHCELKLINR